MKRYGLILLMVLTLVGCQSTTYTSKGVYLGTLHEVEQDMYALGFVPVSTGHETVNEPYVFDDEWKNDWVSYDTRRFADSLGDEAAYTVRYRAINDGVIDVEVSGCEVSYTGHFAAVCGDDGVVQRVNRLATDRSIKDGSKSAALAVIGSSVAIPVVIGILIAVL